MGKRILSAIVLIGIFVPLIIIGKTPFSVLMTLTALVGLYELLHIRETKKKFPFVMKVLAYLMTAFFCLSNYKANALTYIVDYRVMAFLIFAFLLPLIFISDNRKYNLNDALFLIGALLFIGMSFNLLILVRNYDLYHILYLFIVTTITDVYAYITGSCIGIHKLAPKISPHKTIEGLIGGLAMGTFVASVFYMVIINPNADLLNVVLVTLILSFVGQLGDLVFSSIKRYYDVKDFSHLIPGHGGVLDRFDSIIFVVLAFVLFMTTI